MEEASSALSPEDIPVNNPLSVESKHPEVPTHDMWDRHPENPGHSFSAVIDLAQQIVVNRRPLVIDEIWLAPSGMSIRVLNVIN